jgi:hypothetical protein
MLRLLCALGLGLLGISVEGASSRWRWANPQPHGNNLNDLVHHVDRGYVMVCDRGQLYTSPDAVVWQAHELNLRTQLRAATFLGSRLIVTGEAGQVVWSDDLKTFHPLEPGSTDWLEGVAASPTRAVAVGDNGAVYTTDDGALWTQRPLPPAQRTWLRSVAWGGTDPGFFVAVGEGAMILTSPDGVTWTTRAVTFPNGAHLNRVVWAGGGFVVVGDSGTVIFGNAAGASWVRQQGSGATGDLNAAAARVNASRLVAGDLEVLHAGVSIGSVAWTDQTDPGKPAPAPLANYLSALWDGSYFLLGGRTGLLVFGQPTATAGQFNWTPYPSPTRNWIFDLGTATSFGTNISATCVNGAVQFSTNRTTNTFYIGAGDYSTLLHSDQGVTWRTALAPASATNTTFLGIGGNLNGLIAVGSGGMVAFSPVAYEPFVTTNRCASGTVVTETVVTNHLNTLGLAWQAVTSPTTVDLQGASASDSRYVISGAGGFLATSDNGTDWTPRTSGTTAFLSGIEAWPGGFVAVGDAGTVLTSPDGASWTPQSSGTTNWLYRVRHAQGLFVAAGQNGTIATSPDAVTWTLRPTGVTNWLNDAEFVHDRWFVVGNQGTVFTSPDGVTWTRDESLITGKSLYSAATLRGQLVTAGIEGIILRTQVGPFPGPVTIADHPHDAAENVFLFTGFPDQRFRLDRSQNLQSWQPDTELEITDPSGALLFLSDKPNAVDQQFFRAPEVP